MRIDVNDPARRRRGWIRVDPTQRTPRVPLEGGSGKVFLAWDGALDDAGHLRKCLCCGSSNLYRIRSLPSVTPIIVILAFVGAAVGLLGYANNPVVLTSLVVVLLFEVTIILVARNRLVCYRCRSQYSDTPIARYHPRFDREQSDSEQNQPEIDLKRNPSPSESRTPPGG
jgi:hypothetical protein